MARRTERRQEDNFYERMERIFFPESKSADFMMMVPPVTGVLSDDWPIGCTVFTLHFQIEYIFLQRDPFFLSYQ